jgi:hypothetical protein
MKGPRAAAVLVGALVAFVVAVDLVRVIRPTLLLDVEPSWSLPRLALWWGLIAATAAAGGASAGAFCLWSGTRLARASLQPLAIGKPAVVWVAAVAIAAGAFLRLAELERIPFGMWVDDVSLVPPTLALRGNWSDFSNTIREAPFGVPKPYGSVGVLYLEAQRGAFQIAGVSVLGVRLPAALASILSIGTALLLGRELLPRGGGAFAALILAGLRWHLIVSRWGWNAIVLIPIVDAAALLMLRARRKSATALALGSGVVMGLGAHVYLAAWVAASALLLLALWPSDPAAPASDPGLSGRARRAAAFLLGFALLASPLFLFRENRRSGYFARARDHSLRLEVARTRSVLPAFAAAADSLAGPWFLPDPMPLNDIPGRSRLGWLLGIPVAIALARGLLQPRSELSAFLFSHGGAALAASVAGGQAMTPNGYRFAYLTTVTAFAAAAGVLALLALVPEGYRRAAALAAIGVLAISGALGARDALQTWGESRDTFTYFRGQDTMLGRAAARWERYGRVSVDRGLAHHPIALDAVWKYALDPDGSRGGASEGDPSPRSFRIVAATTAPASGERAVERIRDGWGKEWGVVLGRRSL